MPRKRRTTEEQGSERKPTRSRSFYAEAMSEAERLLLSSAAEIEGLDEEIALLRLQLLKAIAEQPENEEIRFKLIGLIVRAVSARYRLSPKAEGDLSKHIAGVLRGIGGVMFPEAFNGIE